MSKQFFVILPSTATLTSIMLGVLAIMVLPDGNFLLAAILILLGSILDVLDGQLAERLDAVSDLGKELDSLADVITFGVAPTILVYHLLLIVGVDRSIAVLTSLTFVLAGAFRLARFNTMPSDRSAFFKGIPIPMASALLITATFWQHWVINIWWTVAVVTVSFLMISPYPFPKSKHVFALPPIVWGGVVTAMVVVWLGAGWQAVPFSIFLIYAISGPALSLYKMTRRRLSQVKKYS